MIEVRSLERMNPQRRREELRAFLKKYPPSEACVNVQVKQKRTESSDEREPSLKE